MRINRNMLLKIARDVVDKRVIEDRSIMAIYLQGSLLSENPLIGNTADIDLFFIHSDEVSPEREIIRISDEVHLDISHHSHRVYRQPRELRVHPWLGPAVYGCKIMYDPQHFIDFTQASVRGQFNTSTNILTRVQKQAGHAREMWEELSEQSHEPNSQDISLYMRSLEHAANAVSGLNGQCLTERRFLNQLQQHAEAVDKPGLQAGFLGLLGGTNLDADRIRSWLPEWANAYTQLPENLAPVRLHACRELYYQRAVEELLDGPLPVHALWPLWHTWTDIICALPENSSAQAVWQQAGETLGLLGDGFYLKVDGLDAYLDQVEEILESWARANGI
jgi:hypothetical protein